MWGCALRSKACAAAVAVAVALGAIPGAAAPARVVSMNLCTDELAMLLAAPGQLVSISYLAADPHVSAMAAEAAAYPKNDGQAEAIFLLHPDLVLAGPYSSRATVGLLRRLGVKVEIVPQPERLDDVPGLIRSVGAALGQEAKAGAMAARFTETLAGLRARRLPSDRAVLFDPNGFTSGAGSMDDRILAAGGFRNVAAELGLKGYARLPLERLVMAAPDLVISAPTYPGQSRPEAIMHHPAIRAMDLRLGQRRLRGAGWDCGTPKLLDAIARLQAAHLPGGDAGE